MKTLLSILIMLSVLTSFAQNPAMMSAEFSQPAVASPGQMASTQNVKQLNGMYKRNYGSSQSDKCDRYQNKMITGTTLTALGGALLIAGVVMIKVGQNKQAANYNSQYGYSTGNGDGLIIGGSCAVGAAVPVIFVGTPIMLVGIIKAKRYCHPADYTDKPAGKESSYMELGTYGNGLVLSF